MFLGGPEHASPQTCHQHNRHPQIFPASPPAKIEAMFAIITVTGEDHTGIIAAVTTALAEQDVNIVDVSQTLMDKWFTMILRVEFNEKATPISTLQGYMDSVGKREGLRGGGASRVDGVGKAEPICGNSHRVAGELEDDGGLGGWRGRSHALDGSADGGLSPIEAVVPAVLAEYTWLPTMWKCPQK